MSLAPDILFLPDWRDGNPYQRTLAASIEAASGLRVGLANYPKGNFPLLAAKRAYPGVKVLHLHWIAPCLARVFWSRNPLRYRLRIWLLCGEILLLRLRGVRVVWTVHNLVAHESVDAQRERLARRWLGRVVSRLIFHSASARDTVFQDLGLGAWARRRSRVIPHGNYIGMYPANPERAATLRQEFGLAADHLVVLSFGALRGYKGVAKLVDAFRQVDNPRLRLIVAGKPFSPQTADDLESAAREDNRIFLRFGFVPDEDVAPLFSLADLVAIPFERTLTSGSAILAMSMGKALLLPEAARIIDVADSKGTLFFAGKDGLRDSLESLPQVDLHAMGIHNAEMARSLDWPTIGRQTVSAYDTFGKNPFLDGSSRSG